MAVKPKFKSVTLLDFYRLFLGLAILEGLLALWFLFRIPSETRNSFLANFSLQRIALGFVFIVVLGVFIYSLYDSFKSQKLLKFLTSRLAIILDYGFNHTLIKTSLILILISSLAGILFYWFPDLQRLVFFLPNDYIFTVLGERGGSLIGWVFLISLQILILYAISGRKDSHRITAPVRLMVVSWLIEIFVILYFVSWSFITRKLSLEVLLGPGVKILVLAVWFSLWAFLNNRKGWAGRYFLGFTCISIWLCVFIVSLQFAQWFDAWGPQPQNHFILLASAFLHGKIYLLNTPSIRHDLTFYNGHWFVPYPPFPAILILPFVAIWGTQAFNLTTFSLALAALAAVTMYLILNRLIRLDWIQLSRPGAIWLTALFSFGTVYWWLSINTGESFFSQIVTVLFCGLAFLSVLKKWFPWITGACLATAILCRPNVFVLWPALLAIAIQLNLREEKLNWKYIFKWGSLSAVPVILGAFFLLYYNYLRFGNFLDFGYATIRGAAYIVQNVRNYGLFNTYYVPFNLHYMFLALPDLKMSCEYYIPRGWGMSIIATTPAVIYLVGKIKVNWWIGGCWCSIILSIILLALYSNNGANQYGYRYVMDFMIPAIMIIAYNAGQKISTPLKMLIITSIFINYYGTISWFRSPC